MPETVLPPSRGELRVAHLGVRPSPADAGILHNVSFELPAGALVAVLGASGSGKSTLARVLAGVQPPTQGEVALDGAALHQYSPQARGQATGYLPQDVLLHGGSVAHNIARLWQPTETLTPEQSDAVVKAARRAGAHELITALPKGYDTLLGHEPGAHALSGGQRQRIALARAIYATPGAGEPTLVVLDEPNSQLDAEGEAALERCLHGLRRQGTTVVVITHRPHLIALASHVLVLGRGKVEQFGPREQVRQWMVQRNQAAIRQSGSARMNADHTPCRHSGGSEMRRALRTGLCGTLLGVLALSAWAALAPLAAAVIAEGTVKSVGSRKTVQHAEGGIVAAIHVKDGDRVVQGQPLITLADERVAAGAQALREQWMASTLKARRLSAETRGVHFAPELDAFEHAGDGDKPDDRTRATVLAQREQELFVARARQQAEQARWLSEQLAQIQREIATQHELIATTESALKLAQRDLAANERLKADGFISEARLAELQRVVADYRARMQAGQSQLAQARQKEADTRLKLSAQKTEFARAAADELKDVTAQLAQTDQALRPALDAQTRQRIVAPVAGEVVDLKAHTVGAAIGPREPVMDIVPVGSELVIEARIAPTDIRDAQRVQASAGVAHVMLTAYRARSTPQVEGRLTYVGADRLTDPRSANPSAPYYVAHVTVSPEALQAASKLAGQPLVLSPGMQAEVFIPTAERSAWRYLFDPVLDGIRRSLRER